MTKLADNLTMLFNEQPFMDRFEAAARAGFRGVEFLFPYAFHADQIAAAEYARDVVSRLFAAYDQDSAMLPAEWNAALPAEEPRRSRHLADFIAGMTDRYAIDQCERIFGRAPEGLRNV